MRVMVFYLFLFFPLCGFALSREDAIHRIEEVRRHSEEIMRIDRDSHKLLEEKKHVGWKDLVLKGVDRMLQLNQENKNNCSYLLKKTKPGILSLLAEWKEKVYKEAKIQISICDQRHTILSDFRGKFFASIQIEEMQVALQKNYSAAMAIDTKSLERRYPTKAHSTLQEKYETKIAIIEVGIHFLEKMILLAKQYSMEGIESLEKELTYCVTLKKHLEEESRYRLDAVSVLNKKMDLCREEVQSFAYEGLKIDARMLSNHISYVLDKMFLDVPSTLLEPGSFIKESYKAQIDSEQEKREKFFMGDFFMSMSPSMKRIGEVFLLDGGVVEGDRVILYKDTYYRFLMRGSIPPKKMIVYVYKEGELVAKEKFALPGASDLHWEKHIVEGGSVSIPNAILKEAYGLSLRISSVFQDRQGLVIGHKGSSEEYQFAFALDDEKPLYNVQFIKSPPWQVSSLEKPRYFIEEKECARQRTFPVQGFPSPTSKKLPSQEPLCDLLVEELKEDPLAICHFVFHEIKTMEPLIRRLGGCFYPGPIYRGITRTLLERQGSSWEQCRLLTYLLRKAGCPTSYITTSVGSIPREKAEGLFSQKIEGESLFSFPGVLALIDGKKVAIFPWLKEGRIVEGHDVYAHLPEDYASADRWLKRYLENDPAIFKHVAVDGNDMAAPLFARFVEENLEKKGLFLQDVGWSVHVIKKQYASVEDFPSPSDIQISMVADEVPRELFAKTAIEFSALGNSFREETVICTEVLGCGFGEIGYLKKEELQGKKLVETGKKYPQAIGFMTVKLPTKELILIPCDEEMQPVDVKVTSKTLYGDAEQYFKLIPGVRAAMCFSFGGEGSGISSLLEREYQNAVEEEKKIFALLGFVGSLYFELCDRGASELATLHKTRVGKAWACGFTKLVSIEFEGKVASSPQIDMLHVCGTAKENKVSNYEKLVFVNDSAGEHHVLRQVFGDKEALSTVRLLQIANKKKEGSVAVTAKVIQESTKNPEVAATFYYPKKRDLNFFDLKRQFGPSWDLITDIVSKGEKERSSLYAYITPGFVKGENGFTELGALIFGEEQSFALISNNNMWLHGGLARPLHGNLFANLGETSLSITPGCYMSPVLPDYTQHWADEIRSRFDIEAASIRRSKIDDVRLGFKAGLSLIADPIDLVTGAFFIDEEDLTVGGLSIRRNYSSKNPSVGLFGSGWKMNFSPDLYEEEGRRYITEADGTTLVYIWDEGARLWRITPEENLGLCFSNEEGEQNLFLQYMQGDTLYEPSGGYRIFQNGKIHKWFDPRGHYLEFCYQGEKISCIKSSFGDECRMKYTPEGLIAEIYATDGRRVYYRYNERKDLVQVTRPSGGCVLYEYDEEHRVIKEKTPGGKILENRYDSFGRVVCQLSPMGPKQQMQISASFTYEEGKTKVTDGIGGVSTYYLRAGLIYQIEDPLGQTITQSWFLNAKEILDGATGETRLFSGTGGYPRKLYQRVDKRGLIQTYLYDKQGKLVSVRTEGEDLTGQKHRECLQEFFYNENNLCIEEKILDQQTVTTYDDRFHYLPSRMTVYRKGSLCSYTGFVYDQLGRVIQVDASGSVTEFIYDTKGRLIQEIRKTGTEDPDLITTYTYNAQGNCIAKTTGDCKEEVEYDIMGHKLSFSLYNRHLELLEVKRYAYNANGDCIWEGRGKEGNGVYLDYHAGGMIKARRQTISGGYAYYLYEYDPRGYLVEEIDPMGVSTYHTYDAIGNLLMREVEGSRTQYTYEPGGKIASVERPLGGKTAYRYATNGLLLQESRSDGVSDEQKYDLYGRVVFERKGKIAFSITYDEAHRRQTRRCLSTGEEEIQEFDLRGNVIKVIDKLGSITEKTYDQQNRLKKIVSSEGRVTTWEYGEDFALTRRPNGEKKIDRYEAGVVVESSVYSKEGILLTKNQKKYDPIEDKLIIVIGDEVKTVWFSPIGKPLRIEEGERSISFLYNRCGSCICKEEESGEKTTYIYDTKQQLVQKNLPGAVSIFYAYDAESNLIESTTASGARWCASYDLFGRRIVEELVSEGHSEQRWMYTYNEGYLQEAVDPLGQTHTYTYDVIGNLVKEQIEDWSRLYTYDACGQLLTAEERKEEGVYTWLFPEEASRSKIERAYDREGAITQESVYIEGKHVYTLNQRHKEETREIEIGDHQREITYQNGRVIKVRTEEAEVIYSYDLAGKLKNVSTPLGGRSIFYTKQGLPSEVHVEVAGRTYVERMRYAEGSRLEAYEGFGREEKFSYTKEGYLSHAAQEEFLLDFGGVGGGRVTKKRDLIVQEVDPLGRIIAFGGKEEGRVAYDLAGRMISKGETSYSWDPWGRLIEVKTSLTSWKGGYDPLGRLVKVEEKREGKASSISCFYYDPLGEFQELGVSLNERIFWKLQGPGLVDAIVTKEEGAAYLTYNVLEQLVYVSTPGGVFAQETCSSFYGDLRNKEANLVGFAFALSWRGLSAQASGLIFMGARHYDPHLASFLSPDPIGPILAIDLYSYANSDPVNYTDPDGRFASKVYKKNVVACGDRYVHSLPYVFIRQTSKFAASTLLSLGITRSKNLEIPGIVKPGLGIGFIPGVMYSLGETKEVGQMLQKYANGLQIDLTHLASYSAFGDFPMCGIDKIGGRFPPNVLLRRRWQEFFEKNGPNALYLQFCHSRGGLQLRNALLDTPPEIRNRIRVVAIAPAAIISREICETSENYMSKLDFVTKTDLVGFVKYAAELTILEPDKEATGIDHSFSSPTFENPIKEAIQQYLKYQEVK